MRVFIRNEGHIAARRERRRHSALDTGDFFACGRCLFLSHAGKLDGIFCLVGRVLGEDSLVVLVFADNLGLRGFGGFGDVRIRTGSMVGGIDEVKPKTVLRPSLSIAFLPVQIARKLGYLSKSLLPRIIT